MTTLYRIGIVGAGGIAQAHGRASRTLPEVRLTAICDVRREAVDRFGDQYEVPNRYTDLDAMLSAEDLDITIICTWGHYHAVVSNTLARSGKVRAILCEKPFCRDAAEAEGMVATAREHGVLLAEAFKFRSHPQHLKMKELADSGRIGALQTIRSTFTGGTPAARRRPELNWRFNKAQGGGAVYDLGCYNIHHARYMFGAEPVRVYAVGHTGPVSGVDESVYAVLEFPGEKTATFTLGFRAYGSQSAEIYGTDGLIRCDAAWNNENQPVSVHARFQGGNTEIYEFAPVDQFALQLRHMCECLETGQSHRISPENSIGQMRVIDALFESMASGRAVKL